MEFKTMFSPPTSKAKECSKTERDNLIFDKVTKKIVSDGTKDQFYERTQTFYESTRLSNKISAFMRGDSSALGVGAGQYGDFTNLPKSLEEVFESGSRARQQFDKLPDSIRGIFNNDYKQFAEAVAKGEFNSRLEEYTKQQLAIAGIDPAKIGTGSGTSQAPAGDTGSSKGGE